MAPKHTTELPDRRRTRRSIGSLRPVYDFEYTLDLEPSRLGHDPHMDDVQGDPGVSEMELEREKEIIRETNTLISFLFHFSPVVLAIVLTQCVFKDYMKLLLKLFASVVINKLRCLALDPSLAAQQDPTSSIIHIYVKLEVALFALSPSSAMLVLAVLVLMGRGGSAQSSIRGNHNRVNMYTVSAAIHESERLERHPGRQRIQRVTSSERVTTLEQMVFEG